MRYCTSYFPRRTNKFKIRDTHGGVRHGLCESNVVIGEAVTSGCDDAPVAYTAFQSPDWWIDTGTNRHICSDQSCFSSLQTGGGSTVLMGNGSTAAVRGVGKVELKLTSGKVLTLRNVLFVPTINKNLISGSLLCREGYKLVFESNKFVLTKFGSFIGKGYLSGGMFRLSVLDCDNFGTFAYSVSDGCVSHVWHSRLCHVNFDSISRMSRMSLIPIVSYEKGKKCEVCVQVKQPRKPFLSVQFRSTAPLELVHSDICEMNGIITKGGKKYFITFIDDATKYCYVYLLRTKDEALHHFQIYKAEVENQLNRKIKRLRSDRGGEYFSNEFARYCESAGIIHERTPPYSPQSNGVAERKNRTLEDLVNAMLGSSGMATAW